MQLSLETLKDFDVGKARALFDFALRQVVEDMLDRPDETKARKVNLEVTLTPLIIEKGELVEVEVSFAAASKIPARHTAGRPVGVTKQGGLFFSADSPDNPFQRTLDEQREED
jgi:hypothetical protein